MMKIGRTLLLDSEIPWTFLPEIDSETLTSVRTRVMYVLTKYSGGARWQSQTGI